jgi:hypothetical protein
METTLSKRIPLSRPKDKSVEAYKAWMMEIADRLTTEPTAIKLTQAEWVANWKEFWTEKAVS